MALAGVAPAADDPCRVPDAPRVVAVGVEVGEDAGIEPENLTFCLEALLGAPPFRRATPRITRLPGDVLRLAYLEVDDGGPHD